MRLPPLNSLRAFEVAARLGGFVAASSELNVTPAAISHQVKLLEAHLGVELFRRLPRGMELTNAGRELLPEISRGLSHFSRAIGSLSGGELRGTLRVNVPPSFATLWLVPRLDGFLNAFPDIQLHMTAYNRAPDLMNDEVDIRIAYGKGNYPGLKTDYIMEETIFPICAPSLLNKSPIRRMADIKNHTLIHDFNVGDDEPSMTWAHWLRGSGVKENMISRHVRYSDTILMVEAAVNGQGVALGRSSVVADHLKSGRLIKPLNIQQTSEYAYYMITTDEGAEKPRVRAFLDWLKRQVDN